MKLWLLRPHGYVDKHFESPAPALGPWDPWYDKAFGFVVAAPTEERARELADKKAGDENRSGRRPWLDAKLSSCTELVAGEVEGVIIRDFASA